MNPLYYIIFKYDIFQGWVLVNLNNQCFLFEGPIFLTIISFQALYLELHTTTNKRRIYRLMQKIEMTCVQNRNLSKK